jgi:phage tail sheath protein FI
MGFSKDFQTYTLCEVMYNYFALFNTGPIILINVFDPADNTKAPVVDEATPMTNGQAILEDKKDVLLTPITVKDTAGAITYVEDTDYTVGYNDDGFVVINRIPSGSIALATASVKVSYTQADPAAIDKTDIIGGIDADSGKGKGLEANDDVFQIHAIIQGIIIGPRFS